MQRLRVGEPLHLGITGFKVGVHYNYTPAGHTLTLSRNDPSRSEIEAVQQGQGVFALILQDEALFFLARFGDSRWQLAHYNWWINPPVMRPDPMEDLARLNDGLSVNACLVNAANGLVSALRTFRLSHEFGCSLFGCVELQSRQVFDPWHYLDLVETAGSKYLDGDGVLENALCVCVADLSLSGPLTAAMPDVRH